MTSVDLSLLLSKDNAARRAAEAQFDAARQSHPQLVATQLIQTLNAPDVDLATRELCAVLARRYLPSMFILTEIHFSVETRESVKAGLLTALSPDHMASLRRKLCSTIGRLGAELLPSNGWPALNDFVQQACTTGVIALHEAALAVLLHMAPACVDVEGWQKCGVGVQAILLDGLAPGRASEVQATALAALAAFLSSSAQNERAAEDALKAASDEKARKGAKAERRQHKAIAASLGEALPSMLVVLEGALQAGGTGATAALEALGEVAEVQPRLFKPVLPHVVEGMTSVALSPLECEVRLAAAEMLLTLCEALPAMCLKVAAFVPQLLGVLLALSVRLGEDTATKEGAKTVDHATGS